MTRGIGRITKKGIVFETEQRLLDMWNTLTQENKAIYNYDFNLYKSKYTGSK
jgi:hypothetical protein